MAPPKNDTSSLSAVDVHAKSIEDNVKALLKKAGTPMKTPRKNRNRVTNSNLNGHHSDESENVTCTDHDSKTLHTSDTPTKKALVFSLDNETTSNSDEIDQEKNQTLVDVEDQTQQDVEKVKSSTNNEGECNESSEGDIHDHILEYKLSHDFLTNETCPYTEIMTKYNQLTNRVQDIEQHSNGLVQHTNEATQNISEMLHDLQKRIVQIEITLKTLRHPRHFSLVFPSKGTFIQKLLWIIKYIFFVSKRFARKFVKFFSLFIICVYTYKKLKALFE